VPRLALAAPVDAPELARLQTRSPLCGHGIGPWSAQNGRRGRFSMKTGRIFIARNAADRGNAAARDAKPWAIDKSYFTPVKRPLYLTDMAVSPARQRRGIGRSILEDAVRIARQWPADAIRLDAWDAEAGAGAFYATCGFVERGHVIYRVNPLVYFERILQAHGRMARGAGEPG
jgi:GNAT superfamily N-acetyltransferase